MLETKCVGDNYEMLVTVLVILVTNIHYRFIKALDSNIKQISPLLSHQHHCHQFDIWSNLLFCIIKKFLRLSDEKGKIGIDGIFLFEKYFINIKLASISPITAVKLYSNILDVGEIADFS